MNFSKARTLALMILVSSSSMYGTVVAAASCTSAAIQISGSNHCFIQTSGASIEALAYFTESTSMLTAGADVDLARLDASGTPGSLIASASVSETLLSAGSPRLGLAKLEIYNQNIRGGTVQGSITDGVHDYSLGTCENRDFYGCGLPDIYPPGKTIAIPFELGTAFLVSGSASASLYSATITAFAFQNVQTIVSFNLFEADGVTPVRVSAVAPEPSTALLLFTGSLLAISFLALRARQSTASAQLLMSIIKKASSF